MATTKQIHEVTRHFIIAALWADCEEGTHPRATKRSYEHAYAMCERFINDAGPLFEQAMARFDHGYGRHPDAGSAEAAFGHDLWLTRRGHGVGFWDREELGKELGQALTAQANFAGEPSYEFYRGWFHLYKD